MLGGDGELTKVQAQADSLGISGQVELLGWVVGDAKRRAFAQATAFVLPSHIEGLPVSMLEAMYCSLPIVICPVGSIPEVLTDEHDALFVRPRDIDGLATAMLRLAEDVDLRDRLGSAANRIFQQRFSMQSVGPRIEALYHEAVNSST